MISKDDILGAKVLVVDDKPPNVLLLERMLHGAGYVNVTSCLRSDQVFELHLQNRYDLILLDLEMPGLDGFEVMEHLKELETGSYLPVLVITAQPGHKLRALKAGARDFVSKPFDLPEVLLRVHNMLEVRLLHRESKRLYDQLMEEHTASRRMLVELLPSSIADRVGRLSPITAANEGAGGEPVIIEGYAELTMLFADIVSFTRFSEGASAQVLLGVLEAAEARFGDPDADRVLDETRTMGDAYLAALDLSGEEAGHALGAARQALALVGALDRFNARSRYPLRVRIGLDVGETIDGLVRTRKVAFEM